MQDSSLKLSRRSALLASAGLFLTTQVEAAASHSDPWNLAEEIVKRIRPPVFPDRVYNVCDFGADGASVEDSSEAIAHAIATCNAAGGGRVLVPEGDYLTGPIHLRSNVELHVTKGAFLRFKTDPKAYLPQVLTRWEGVELYNYSPFIYALDCENIAITGGGVIDGQASRENWWPWKGPWGHNQHGWKQGMPDQVSARDRLVEMGEAGVPVEQRVFGEGDYLRPNFVQFYRCKNVLMDGVSLRRSPMWQIHPVLCENVILRNLDINSHGPNNDGSDPESCKYVLIENNRYSTGDDCIAIDSGRNADGRRLHAPSENIVIRNCHMEDGHGGLAIGSIISGGARNIFAHDCQLNSPNLGTAIRLKNNAMRGGLVENCHFRRISVGEVSGAGVTIDYNYEEGGNGTFTPVTRNISISEMTVTKCERPVDIQGLINGVITDVRFQDCQFEHAAKPSIVAFASDLTLKRISVNGHRVASWT